jgi:YggT family protein
MFILADVQGKIADVVHGLFSVYIIVIIAYIISSMYLSFGGRIPYSRWSRAILDFLRDTAEPYLGIFRRFIPPLGPIDLSPMIGIFLLLIADSIIGSALSS